MSYPFLPALRPAGCGDPGDEIAHACVFDGAQYLAWPSIGSQTDRRLWTLSVWVRRGKLGTVQSIFSTGVEGNGYDLHDVRFGTDDRLWFGLAYEIPKASFCATVAAWRDPAAWLHIVAVFDSANATAADRMRIYVNGERQAVVSAGTATYPIAQNTPGFIGNHQPIRVGNLQFFGAYLSATLAELNFVWGQGLDPSAFGYRNRFGVWVPKRYTGAYGAIGRRLAFDNPLALGADTSGNGLPFTATGLAATHQVVDTPTHGYATLNGLEPVAAQALSLGNLKASISNSSGLARHSTVPMTSGRWYAEVECVGSGGGGSGNNLNLMHVGVQRLDKMGVSLWTSGVVYYSDATRLVDGITTAFGAPWKSPGTVYVVGVLLDLTAATVEYFLNGVSQGVVPLPVAGAAWLFAGVWASSTGSGTQTWNFGQRAFAYPTNRGSAPTLSTPNLPCPPIKRPERYATTRLRSGAAGVADLPWSPLAVKTLVLSKRRDGYDWRANDTLRPGRAWAPNLAGGDFADPDGLAFTGSGYTIGGAPAYAGSRIDYIWRASAAAGFDILLVNHTTGAPTTVPHAVGGIIDFALVVPVSAGGNRRIYHRHLAAGQYLILNSTAAVATDAGWWSSSAIDLTLGASLPSGQYEIYAWRAVPGFSAFGSYIGIGLADGPFGPTDFAPAAAIIRRTDYTQNTYVLDTARNPVNPLGTRLYANLSNADDNVLAAVADFVSNGIKIREGADTNHNGSGGTYLYAAWAATPGKFARAR